MIVTATQARRQFFQLLKAVERGTPVSITYKDIETVCEIAVIKEHQEQHKKRLHRYVLTTYSTHNFLIGLSSLKVRTSNPCANREVVPSQNVDPHGQSAVEREYMKALQQLNNLQKNQRACEISHPLTRCICTVLRIYLLMDTPDFCTSRRFFVDPVYHNFRITISTIMEALTTKEANSMAQYNLWVSRFAIEQIRSNDQDTLVASMGLRVMNAEGGLHMDWPAQSAQLGTGWVATGKGDYSNLIPQLMYQNVDVPDPTPESADGGAIYWSFLLVNAGHPDVTSLVNAITGAADAVAGALLGTGNILAMVAGGVIVGTDALVKLLTTGCDGVVAAQNWAFTAAQLAAMASGATIWNNWQNYPGTSSPPQCGATSNYDVQYIMSQVLIPVPDLTTVRTTPDEAMKKVEQAGFVWIEDSFDPVGGKFEYVEEQDPKGGTMAPYGKAIHVVIATPGKG